MIEMTLIVVFAGTLLSSFEQYPNKRITENMDISISSGQLNKMRVALVSLPLVCKLEDMREICLVLFLDPKHETIRKNKIFL